MTQSYELYSKTPNILRCIYAQCVIIFCFRANNMQYTLIYNTLCVNFTQAVLLFDIPYLRS